MSDMTMIKEKREVNKAKFKSTRKKTSGKPPRGAGANLIYQRLKSEILDLTLQPGTPLDEVEIGQRCGVSRQPVREALIRLSGEGLIQLSPNRAPTVAPFDLRSLASYLDAITLLYRLGARLAARNNTAEGVARLRHIQQDLERATANANVSDNIRFNRDFHVQVAEMSGNEFIAAWTKNLLDHGQRTLRFYIGRYGDRVPKARLGEHHNLLKAIEAGDESAAEEAGRRDAEVIIEGFVDFLRNRPTLDTVL